MPIIEDTPRKPSLLELNQLAGQIKLLVFDVDGVLTDGGLYYGPEGEALKRFDVKDGHAIVMARLAGLPAAVLTARRSTMVEVRAKELQLLEAVQGRRDKRAALGELLHRHGIEPSACAYMGDDINDLGPMELVGLSACPSNAAPEVRKAASFISSHPGGQGAARELIELCLKATDRWSRALEICKF
jgi:3-deoxy-D-manno-octulosonate 8-phosphate phosphatase (KDO 8-P phosphatase)